MLYCFNMSLKQINYWKWANGQYIYESENKIDPSDSSVPILRLYACI